MRVPALPNPPTFNAAEDAAIAESIKQRRGAIGLLPVDLTLLHSPPVASGWYAHLDQQWPSLRYGNHSFNATGSC